MRPTRHQQKKVCERECSNNKNQIASALVVRTSKNTGVMFLCEVALGKESIITIDNPSLIQPPAGFDSVVARGSVEPGTPLLQPCQDILALHFESDPLAENPV